MPMFEDLVSRQQRSTGDPRASRVPGGPQTPSAPKPFVAPPSAAMAPVGRPSAAPPPFAGGAGPALPSTGAAGPAASLMARAGSTAPSTPPQQTTQPPAQPGQPGDTPGPVAGAPSAGLVYQVNRVPARSELLGLPPGVRVHTPYGEMDNNGDIQVTPGMEQHYQAAVEQRHKAFGWTPFGGDPNAPRPQIKLGRPSINPFTGQWSS